MTTVLADVALESEAALALAIHAARSGEMRAEADAACGDAESSRRLRSTGCASVPSR
jgi:hypothetical protein